MSTYEWISIVQIVVTASATYIIWRWKQSAITAVTEARVHDRLNKLEEDATKASRWRHDVMIPWQTTLLERLEERFVTRREWNERDRRQIDDDSPFPPNQDRRRRR